MQLPPNTTIASGPVIIENNKVLLNREKKEHGSELFMFPGGVVENFDDPLEKTAKREVMEELGIEIEIIRPLQTIIAKREWANNQIVILVHYLARRIGEINPGEETIEWGWFDINNLPDNRAENVYEIVNSLKDLN